MENMWISVENQRISGDFELGISQGEMKGFVKTSLCPQPSPQLFTDLFSQITFLVRKVSCNYRAVIWFSHKLTAVITTNFKYKTFSKRVLEV